MSEQEKEIITNTETADVQDASDDTQQQPQTMTDKLIALRQEWTQEVESLNEGLKNLAEVDHTLNIIYTKRQKAVDLYYGTLGVLHKQMRNYKQQYANLYNTIKSGQYNGMRYGSDTAINTQIDAQLIELKEVIDELKDFTDFMWETVKSMDGIQYAINSKIKVYELMNGLKF